MLPKYMCKLSYTAVVLAATGSRSSFATTTAATTAVSLEARVSH
jgi:hypothetical protein